MKKNNFEKGKEGERLASDYLKNKGYEILENNWRFSRNEIDIIAKEQDTIVIVEVKYRYDLEYGDPSQTVDLKKRRILVETSDRYMDTIDDDLELRFDIISIQKNNEITHIEDSFQANEV